MHRSLHLPLLTCIVVIIVLVTCLANFTGSAGSSRSSHMSGLTGLHLISNQSNHDEPYMPFLSGDQFRLLSTRYNHILYVKTDKLLFTTFPNHPFILITHNSDIDINDKYIKNPYIQTYILNNKQCLKWYAQNYKVYNDKSGGHDKIVCIPIGLANQQWNHGSLELINKYYTYRTPDTLYALFISKYKTLYHRDHWSSLILLGINTGTYPERNTIVKTVESTLSLTNSYYDVETYLTKLQHQSLVTICPRGNGLDTHRLWESLYMGCVPLIHRSQWVDLFSTLPVMVVEDWNAVTYEEIDKQMNSIYQKFIKGSYKLDSLFIDYWINRLSVLKE